METGNEKALRVIRETIGLLEAQAAELESQESEASVQAKQLARDGICVLCKEPLDGGKAFRGAHARCHRRVLRAIERKEVTECQAVSRGWLLPAEKGGRRHIETDDLGRTIKAKKQRPVEG